MVFEYRIYSFAELTTQLLYDILALRSKIFVVEQNIVYLDIDRNDQKSLHVCLTDGDTLAGYARILPPGTKFPEAAIGRLVIDQRLRGQQLGAKLMLYCVDQAYERFGSGVSIVIEAQAQLQSFYESLGYQAITPPYMLEGLMHVKMAHKKEASAA